MDTVLNIPIRDQKYAIPIATKCTRPARPRSGIPVKRTPHKDCHLQLQCFCRQTETYQSYPWKRGYAPSTVALPMDDSDDYTPSRLYRRGLSSVPISTIIFSLVPFVLTWIATVIVAHRKLFPVLSGDSDPKDALPVFHTSTLSPVAGRGTGWQRSSAQKIGKIVFSTSIGLSAVLVELLLCEISSTLNPAARGLALQVTLSLLLVSSVLVIPALEIHGIVKAILGDPSETLSTTRSKPKLRLALELVFFVLWLLVFWYIPQASILRSSLHSIEHGGHEESEHAFSEACLERIGIIGISLMASLAGFAAVSSLWQTFGVRHPFVSDTDISRKEAGLNATEEMLNAKRSRLRALQRKLSEAASTSEQKSFMGRVIGNIRGNPDVQELRSLEMEVSGLETMRFTLFSTLSNLRSRHTEQQRSKTNLGRLLNICNTAFAIYCAYRICATSLSSLRRWWQPRHSFATSDPINNVLALLTTHWDSDLDRAAWSRQISFLLSGFMLLLSFNAVLQTFRLFSRFFPKLVQHAQTSLPLITSQVTGTYVISSALLLRSNLPEEVSSVISDAIGAPLDGRFVEGWFESWFLVAVVLTAVGILVGRKAGGDDGTWDDDGGIEMGSKRS